MSIDFDKIISSVMSEGCSAEDIAEKFSEALNRVTKAKKISTRDGVIEKIEKTFNEHVEKNTLDLADAGALVWLCIVKDTDEGKAITSTEDLSDLMNFIYDDIEGTIEKWKIHKAVEPIINFDSFFNKRKETKGNRGGTDRRVQTDEEKVRAFLKDLFS